MRAAFGQRLDQVKRSRIGPMQILEGEDDRLGPRPRQKPCRHRRELPPPQFLRRELRGALLGERNVDQRRDQRRIFAHVEANQP